MKDKNLKEYMSLCHAIQTGIAQMIANGDTLADPKHLRVGIDTMKVEQGALAELLIDKGIFTKDEYFEKIIKFLKIEVENSEIELSKMMGVKITLL